MLDKYARLYGWNKQIAVEPFPDREIKTTVHSGFATINQKVTLTKLKVLAGNMEGVPKGSSVYVLGEHFKSAWGQKVYTLEDGTKFILMPETEILLVEHEK